MQTPQKKSEQLTAEEFFALVKSVNSTVSVADFDTILNETPLDSLDLLSLRSSLELCIGRHIADKEWLGARTLNQLFEAVR